MATTAPSVTSSQESSKSFTNFIKQYILIPLDSALLASFPEIGHLAPVILTLGTAFLALITLNLPLATFSASSFESLFLYNAVKLFSDYTFTGVIDAGENIEGCKSKFQTMNPSRFNWFMEQGIKKTFPNQALYFISYAAGYLIQAMQVFSKELSELGPQYSNRTYFAMIGAAFFIALYTVYLLAHGCDGIFTLLSSIFIGLIVGILICLQNYTLFGKTSVNVLFIPPLVRKTGQDFVCVASKTNN
jgi:hypothetical protein